MDDNKISKADLGYAALKAAVGSIPFAGAAAGEILGLIVTPPMEKRKAQWLKNIGERILALEEKQNIKLIDLQDNPQFVDTVFQATSYALKTSDTEKLRAFQNTIVNTAMNECPDEIQSQIFLTLIDNFTSLHIKILLILNNPPAWFKENNIEFPNNVYSAGLSTVVFKALPELYPQKVDLVKIIWDDLLRAGLHNTPDLGAMMTGSSMAEIRTTVLGRKFISFISESSF